MLLLMPPSEQMTLFIRAGLKGKKKTIAGRKDIKPQTTNNFCL